jgi:DNA-binding transcriptional LysR family regulator
MRRGVQQIEFLADPTSGQLRIGSATPLVDQFLPAVLDRLTARYPRLSCHMTDADTPTLAGLLHERKVDLVVSRTWGSHFGDNFTGEYLFDETLFVVAGLSNPWQRRRSIDFTELLDEPWTLPDLDTVVGAMISEGFRRARITLPIPRVVSGSMAVRTRLIEGGRFLTMLPGSVLYFGTPRLKVKALPVALPLPSQPVEIITLRERLPNPIGKLFVDELRALVPPAMKQGSAAKDSRSIRTRHRGATRFGSAAPERLSEPR